MGTCSSASSAIFIGWRIWRISIFAWRTFRFAFGARLNSGSVGRRLSDAQWGSLPRLHLRHGDRSSRKTAGREFVGASQTRHADAADAAGGGPGSFGARISFGLMNFVVAGLMVTRVSRMLSMIRVVIARA